MPSDRENPSPAPTPEEQVGALGRDMRANVTSDESTSAEDTPAVTQPRNPSTNVTRAPADGVGGAGEASQEAVGE